MARDLDMLSLLPDALLLVIVSLLPFKEAARTCILSKRWLKMWQSSKNVEFNELDLAKVGESDETREAQRRAFLIFITNWIAQYKDLVVDKFSLKVSPPENCSDAIKSCVAFATRSGIKELELDFSSPRWEENDFDGPKALVELSRHVYGHGTLESLKLYSCSFVMPDLLNFQALKDVSFGWIKLNTSTLQTLLSTCRLIENLSLKKCWGLEHFDMGEEGLGLKSLVIDKCNFRFDYLRFKAPHLKFFKYCGVVGISYIDVRPHVIEEVDIDFGLEPRYYECGTNLYKLLEDLFPVRVLTVCSFLLQAVPSGDEPVRVQCGLNVRHLILKTQMHPNELCGFMFLLNSCPKLDKLTVDIGLQKILPGYSPPDGVNLAKFWEKTIVPLCLRRTLKVVELKGFRGTMDELMACKYLIQAGSVLKKINIDVLKEENGNIEKVEMRRALARCLLTVPKASRNLEISIE